MNKTAILILAAGNSSRLGKPKQLIPFKGKTMIAHIAEEASAAADDVLIITGANADKVVAALSSSPVKTLFNPSWEQGIGTGIAAGVAALQDKAEFIITAVCDQPFVSAEIFRSLIRKQKESGKGIVASSYADTLGTPVLFHKKYFSELQQLDAAGAKKLLKLHGDDAASVTFTQGDIDIDTADDLAALDA